MRLVQTKPMQTPSFVWPRLLGVASLLCILSFLAPSAHAGVIPSSEYDLYYYNGWLGSVIAFNETNYKRPPPPPATRILNYDSYTPFTTATWWDMFVGTYVPCPFNPSGLPPAVPGDNGARKWVCTYGVTAVPKDTDLIDPTIASWTDTLSFNPADNTPTDGINGVCDKYNKFVNGPLRCAPALGADFVNAPVDTSLSFLDYQSCASCAGSAGGASCIIGCVNISIPLGTAGPRYVRGSAGHLRIFSENLTNGLASRSALQYLQPYGTNCVPVTVTRDANGWLQQIVTTQVIAQISDVTSGFSVTVYTNHIAPDTLRSTTTVTSNGPNLVISFDSDDLGVWTKQYEPTTEEGGHPALALVEMDRTGVILRRWIDCTWSNETEWVRATLYRDGGPDGGALLSRHMDTYHPFTDQHGAPVWRLVRSETGSGSTIRASTTEYDEVARVSMTIDPDGRWTRSVYESTNLHAKVIQTITPWLNAPTNAWTDPSQCRIRYSDRSVSTGICKVTTLTDTLVIAGQTNSVNTRIIVQTTNTFAKISETNIVLTADSVLTTSILYDPINRPFVTTFPDSTIESNVYSTLLWTNPPFSNRPSASTVTYRGSTNLLNGTKTITINDTLSGGVIQRQSYLIADGVSLLVSDDKVVAVDSEWRPTLQTSFNHTNETVAGCCGVAQTIDTEGVITDFAFDDLKRQISTTRAGITSSNAFDAAGRTFATYRFSTATPTPILLSSNTYNAAGELIATANALGNTTTFSNWTDSANGWIYQQTTYPDGTWTRQQSYRDGQPYQTSGTAVHDTRYSYSIQSDGTLISRQTKLDTAGNPTDEWTESYTDIAGRPLKTMRNGGVTLSQSFYNSLGQLWKQVDADGVTTLSAFNDAGQQEVTALDMNRNDQIDYAGSDRISRTQTSVATNSGIAVQRTVSSVWTTEGSTNSTVVAISDASPDSHYSWQIANNLTNTSTTTIDRFHAAKTVTVTTPDHTQTINVYTNGRLCSVTRLDPLGVQLSSTHYTLDDLGRQILSTDTRNIVTATGYNIADQVIAVTNALGTPEQQTTIFQLDTMGRRVATLLPDNNATYVAFHPTGEVATNWGARTYPVAYTIDYAGRKLTMTTWTNFTSNSGAALTTWHYNPTNGLLVFKEYNNNQGPTYTYTPAGRPQTRTWARAVTTTYGYNNAAEPITVSYSDSTPAVTNTLDRLGRRIGVATTNDALVIFVNEVNQVTNETHTAGLLAGYSLATTFDPLQRRSSLSLTQSGTSVSPVTFFSYNPASQLQVVSNTLGHAATYSYLPGADQFTSLVFTVNGNVKLTTAKTFDNLYRLTAITNLPSTASAISAGYTYNLANQRTRADLSNTADTSDTSYWSYSYDSLGQVTNGTRRWTSDNTPVAGQDYQYTFDDIGNRISAGTTAGASIYSANQLNQYTQRTIPGVVEISGSAATNATVTVNNRPVTRQNEYFYGSLNVPNETASIWTNLNIVAVLKNAGTSQTDIVTQSSGHKFVPKTPEQFLYDVDGNLTNDTRWVYTWDAENRLISMQTASNAITASVPPVRLDFAYDAQSRRIGKKIYSFTSESWILTSESKFLYDDWNLISEISNLQSEIHTNSYTWGLDLSGTPQGAGGIGGLLFETLHPLPLGEGQGEGSTVFPCFDGNGNVSALIDASSGTTAAQYEYSPFGEAIRATGPMAKVSPFRFSTKYLDEETGLYYYGYRYYNPILGRFDNRDPVEELDLLQTFNENRKENIPHYNLRSQHIKKWIQKRQNSEKRYAITKDLNTYSFVQNNSPSRIDLLGLSTIAGYIEKGSGIFAHWALYLGGFATTNGYGFGPTGSVWGSPGTTVGYETVDPITDFETVIIRNTGYFLDDGRTSCCGATPARIRTCAEYYKSTWNGSTYTFPTRQCRHYVLAIVDGCCMKRYP